MSEPDPPPPISATEALALCDKVIALAGIWEKSRGKMGTIMRTVQLWMRQIRPHLAEAAARSNDGREPTP